MSIWGIEGLGPVTFRLQDGQSSPRLECWVARLGRQTGSLGTSAHSRRHNMQTAWSLSPVEESLAPALPVTWRRAVAGTFLSSSANRLRARDPLARAWLI